MTRVTSSTDDSAARAPLAGPALVIAVVVIAAWLGLLVWLLVEVDAGEVVWTRLLVVLGSVEAVAFAAAGALFGTTVQRRRVDDQRERAEKAESRAEGAESDALNGQKLAAAVKAGLGTDVSTRERLSAPTETRHEPLLDLAHRLFPD